MIPAKKWISIWHLKRFKILIYHGNSIVLLHGRTIVFDRYSVEKSVAWITGKPANSAPPPISSQISLPSFTGPTAFNAILRFLAKNECHATAPKSNPSKWHIRKAATTLNTRLDNPSEEWLNWMRSAIKQKFNGHIPFATIPDLGAL